MDNGRCKCRRDVQKVGRDARVQDYPNVTRVEKRDLKGGRKENESTWASEFSKMLLGRIIIKPGF